MKNIENIRPYLTYDEQIEKLSSDYNLIIKNPARAKSLLKTYSYYDLINGYQECFIKDGVYIDNITIDDLALFLEFDRSFQSILFKYSVYAENKFKNILANVIASKYGITMHEYLDQNNYRKNGIYVYKTLNKLKNYPYSDYVDNPTKHYVKTKKHIPPWILFKNITFNQATDIYKNLKIDDKNKVNDEMIGNLLNNKFKISSVTKSIIIIRKFRNSIAHNLKFATTRVNENIILNHMNSFCYNTLIESEDYKIKRGVNDPYSFIISLSLILNESFIIEKLYEDLSRIIIITNLQENDHMDIFRTYCDITGIPQNIIERFKKHINRY